MQRELKRIRRSCIGAEKPVASALQKVQVSRYAERVVSTVTFLHGWCLLVMRTQNTEIFRKSLTRHTDAAAHDETRDYSTEHIATRETPNRNAVLINRFGHKQKTLITA